MAVRIAWGGIDSEALVARLTKEGVEPRLAEVAGEPVLEVPCADSDGERGCDEVLARVETLLAELGLPLVPERGENQIYIRPPTA